MNKGPGKARYTLIFPAVYAKFNKKFAFFYMPIENRASK
jgi:hypothetical protein